MGLECGSGLSLLRATLAAALLATGWPAPVLADEAADLAQAVHARPAGRDLTTVSLMELTDKGRAPRQRELVAYRLNKGRGEAVNLIRFLDPADIAGIGLLSLDKADEASEQWLYLPELDRVRRIAGDRKGGRFVGSDLNYEDLQERKPSRDRHRLIGKEPVGGVDCDLLESTPVEASNSVYLKRISWVDRATAMVMRVDYFEKDLATPSKRWLLLSRKKHGEYWTVMDSRVTDLATGHETRMTVQSVLYDRKLPAKLFTPQALADESIEAEYRP